jgi:hypothetical protein
VNKRQRLLAAVKWDEPPPDTSVVYAPIMSPDPGQVIRSVVVASQMASVKVHWIADRTTGCIGRENGCEGCIGGRSVKWRGYLGVYRPDDGRYWLAEITPGASTDVAALVFTKAQDLRGYRLSLSRPGRSRTGKVRAALDAPPARGPWLEDLPEAFDVRESLLLVWQRLGVRAADACPDEGGPGE